jgi:pimeloyl-ACP methyl ester carboxylesterase
MSPNGAPSIWVDLLGAQVHTLGREFRGRVIEAGSGPALLLLHGIGGHAEAYARNIVRLSRGGRRVLAPDFLWHGLAAKPPYVDGEDIPLYARQLIDLMDSEGIARADIEGESLGGWVALWLALNHPDRVHRLILNTTAGIAWDQGSVPEKPDEGRKLLAERSLRAINEPDRETIKKRLEWLMVSPDRIPDELVEVRYRFYSDPETQSALRKVFENAFAGIGAPRKTIPEAALARVAVPTLVLWTEKNPGTGPEVGRRIAQLIPGARFVCMADCAHWPQWERPEEHDRVVTAVLDGVPVASA